MEEEYVEFASSTNKKSILNNLKKFNIPDEIRVLADVIYKMIIENKNLIYRKINLVMFMYYCCLLAYNYLKLPVTSDELREEFKISKGDEKKCFSLFSAIRINMDVEFINRPPEHYYSTYINRFNDLNKEDRKRVKRPLSPEEKEHIMACKKKKIDHGIDDSIGNNELNKTFLESLMKFSSIILERSAELRTGSPSTAHAGIFYYYIVYICDFQIPNDILTKITKNSYATDSKNKDLVADVIKRK